MEYEQSNTASHKTAIALGSKTNPKRLTDNRTQSISKGKLVKQLKNSTVQKKQIGGLNDIHKNEISVQLKENNTGLPDNLKSGIENLSGHSMDDVKVHYNSSQPAQLNAHAFAQGNQIHVAAGQEKHLPHEAWHVVQQKQGRVKPTKQLKSKVNINNDISLEKEADVMGVKAMTTTNQSSTIAFKSIQPPLINTVQRVELKLQNDQEIWTVNSKEQFSEIKQWIDKQEAELNRKAIFELMTQLKKEGKPTKNELFLFNYAHLKFLEVTEKVAAKLPKLQQNANPMNIGNIQAFIHAQALYQSQLAKTFDKAEIMRTHQSIGLEFEFANYTIDGDLGSHSVLASSKPLSNLFNLTFVLETDSGHELEIGLPPFLLVQNTTTKARIANIWLTMRSLMAKIRERCKGQDMNYLVSQIQTAGLGTGWVLNAKSCEGLTVASERTKHKGTNEDDVYSQLNISMSGKESAKHLKKIAKEGKYTTANERELIIPIYGVVFKILSEESHDIENMTEEIFTHLAKYVTSIMAIPSILISDSDLVSQVVDNSGLFDLHSTVKELHGIWIKDSLPNILRTISAGHLIPAAKLLQKVKRQLMDFIAREINEKLKSVEFKKAEQLYAKKTTGILEEIERARNHGETWFDSCNWGEKTHLMGSIDKTILLIDNFIKENKLSFFPEFKTYKQHLLHLKQRFSLFHENTLGTDDREANGIIYLGTEGTKWGGVQENITQLVELSKEIRVFRLGSKLEHIFLETISNEIEGTISTLIKSKSFETSPKTEFNQGEEFGSGLGVRKDTHIPTIKTSNGGGKNVAEIRGDALIEEYLSN